MIIRLAVDPSKRYGLGFSHPVQKSTLPDANETWDWRIWADVTAVQIKPAKTPCSDIDLDLHINDAVYAVNDPKTIIDTREIWNVHEE